MLLLLLLLLLLLRRRPRPWLGCGSQAFAKISCLPSQHLLLPLQNWPGQSRLRSPLPTLRWPAAGLRRARPAEVSVGALRWCRPPCSMFSVLGWAAVAQGVQFHNHFQAVQVGQAGQTTPQLQPQANPPRLIFWRVCVHYG